MSRHPIVFAVVACLSLVGCVDEQAAMKLRPGVKLELYVVSDSETNATKPLKDADRDEMLHLVTPPIITGKDVTAASVVTDEVGSVSLSVKVDNAGAKRLEAATAVMGGRIALVIDGNMVNAPVVHAQISSKFMTSSAYTEADWKALIE